MDVRTMQASNEAAGGSGFTCMAAVSPWNVVGATPATVVVVLLEQMCRRRFGSPSWWPKKLNSPWLESEVPVQKPTWTSDAPKKNNKGKKRKEKPGADEIRPHPKHV